MAEFDDIQKIWDAQNAQDLYNLDEKAMLARIQSGLPTVRRLSSISEWVLALIYLIAGLVVFYLHRSRPVTQVLVLVQAAFMLVIAAWVIIHHFQRAKAGRMFDRSLRGDLEHTISIARFQLRMAQLVRWSLLPLGIVMMASGWESGKLLKVSLVILVSFSLSLWVTGKGYRKTKQRIQQLEELQQKLE